MVENGSNPETVMVGLLCVWWSLLSPSLGFSRREANRQTPDDYSSEPRRRRQMTEPRRREGQGTGTPAPDFHRAALAYLLALVRAQVPLHETRAITATAVVRARARGLTDSGRSWEWRGDVPVSATTSPSQRHDLLSLPPH
jgi:hypothetical protein